ncbi:hypothetical protein ACOME3_008148 [Neoechinorhynchus agilis]
MGFFLCGYFLSSDHIYKMQEPPHHCQDECSISSVEPSVVALLNNIMDLLNCDDTTAPLIDRLSEMLLNGNISMEDLDAANLVSLFNLTLAGQLGALDEFTIRYDPHGTPNRAALLSNMLEKHKQRYDSRDFKQSKDQVPPAMNAIIERTQYAYTVSRSQRRYGPATTEPPPANSSIYIGRIPKSVTEDKLIEVFEQIGKIYELRFLLDSQDGLGRGFCFLTYCNREDAQKAIEQLDGYELEPGHGGISVNESNTQLTLYVAGIPRSKNADEIKEEFCRQLEGVVKIDVNHCATAQNRGYCFVHFASQHDAVVARRIICDERRALGGFRPLVLCPFPPFLFSLIFYGVQKLGFNLNPFIKKH